jgi:DNA-binding IclR family transcriptional regulator
METAVKSLPQRVLSEASAAVNLPTAEANLAATPELPATGAMKAYRIPNLARACQVMRLFAYSDEKLSSSAVARRLKIPRTTVLRILHTLTAERLLQRNGCDFFAAGELSRLGLRTEGGLRTAATPVLRALAQETNASTQLVVLADDKAVVAETCETQTALRATFRAGMLLDLHCTAPGKILLALGSSFRLGTLLAAGPLEAHTNRSMTSGPALTTECAQIARQGYAVDRGEYKEGVCGVAAPVRDSGGSLVAVLSISFNRSSLSDAEIAEASSQVTRAARQLGSQIVPVGQTRPGNA